MKRLLAVTFAIVIGPLLLGAKPHRHAAMPAVSDEPAPAVATAAGDVNVNVGSNFFTPKNLTVPPGTTILWTWTGNFHSTTSDSGLWDSGVHNVPFTFSFVFNSVADFPYHCSVHGGNGGVGMSGTIKVVTAPSILQITAISRPTSGANAGHVLIDGKTDPNAVITMKTTADLGSSFQMVTKVIADANGIFHFDDADAATTQPAMRFYRAEFVP